MTANIVSKKQKFGKLTTVGRFTKNGRAYWHCTCECGNEKDIREDSLQAGTISCGCANKKDITGQKFNRLTVLRRAERTSFWVCQCECGNIIEVAGDKLQTGHTKSCGCYSISGRRRENHGMAKTPEYYSWQDMKDRCYNSNNTMFKHYGDRGIIVCSEWKDSFETFYVNMGPRPEGTSIDRIDVNGNYEPSNCRWATNAEQARNTTRTVLITYDGKTQCLSDWAIEIGISFKGLKKRLAKMTIEQALTTPLSKKHSSRYRDQEHEYSIFTTTSP